MKLPIDDDLRSCANALLPFAIEKAQAGQRNLGQRWLDVHDGKDRWYLEALGIGADQHWDAYG